jgi:hypothetical protein
MNGGGAVVGGGNEPGNGPGRGREWLEGFLWGVCAGGGVVVCLWLLARRASRMEFVGRVSEHGERFEGIVRWWASE